MSKSSRAAFQEVLNALRERGRDARRGLDGLFSKLGAGEQRRATAVKKLSRRAQTAKNEVRRVVDQVQARVVEASGVATQAQVREISRELGRLGKKLDALGGRKTSKAAVRA